MSDLLTGAAGQEGLVPDMPAKPRAFDAIVPGWLTAGTLDILDAIVVTLVLGGRPARMLQGIASGLLGPAAYAGGLLTAALGLLLHFTIACGAATVYYVASTRWPLLTRKPLLCGPVFGLCVWAVMRYIVIPLSLVQTGGSPTWPLLLNQWGIHALGVGLPIALFASRAARRASRI